MKTVVLGLAALTAGVLVSRPSAGLSELSEVLDATEPVSVWLAFDPVNCRITDRTIQQLVAIRNEQRADVRVVLVGLPKNAESQRRILDAFGTDLPVEVDERGKWRSVLEHYAMGSAIVVVGRFGKVEAVGLPETVNPALPELLGYSAP